MTSPELVIADAAPAATPERWICWPDPDRVCLEGGCGYCLPDLDTQTRQYVRANYRRWTRDQVVAYADANGLVVSNDLIDLGMRSRSTRHTEVTT